MKLRLFPVIGGQVINVDTGKVYAFNMWWPMRIATALFSIFGKKNLDTTILVEKTFNGIGKVDQAISVLLCNPRTADMYWGVNLDITQARKIAKVLNDLCDRLESLGMK